jgi:hypothetical protein
MVVCFVAICWLSFWFVDHESRLPGRVAIGKSMGLQSGSKFEEIIWKSQTKLPYISNKLHYMSYKPLSVWVSSSASMSLALWQLYATASEQLFAYWLVLCREGCSCHWMKEKGTWASKTYHRGQWICSTGWTNNFRRKHDVQTQQCAEIIKKHAW